MTEIITSQRSATPRRQGDLTGSVRQHHHWIEQKGSRPPEVGATISKEFAGRFGLTGERGERRLAAILAADIAGYSRLMGGCGHLLTGNDVRCTVAIHIRRGIRMRGD